MTYLLIIIYGLTLVYFGLSERVSRFVFLLALQGLILFALVFESLNKTNTIGLILVLLETIVVKTILIPWFLNKVRRRNELKRIHESLFPVFYNVIIIVLIWIFSFLLGNKLQFETLHTTFFSAALASVICGIYFIIIHKNVFSHLTGYLIIENGVFLLSLSVGSELPYFVSLAVLLDVLMGVLVIGLFLNKVRDTFDDISVNSLSKLKD